jgi:hypothetical protein
MRPLLVLASLLLLAGCASGSDDGRAAPTAPSSAPSSAAPAVEDALVVELDRGAGGETERYTLACTDPVSGEVPDPAAACAHLRQQADPFAPLAPDVVCTEQFGGPQTARVTGRWAGADVDLQVSRTDGCRISQWDRLGPLLPGPVG